MDNKNRDGRQHRWAIWIGLILWIGLFFQPVTSQAQNELFRESAFEKFSYQEYRDSIDYVNNINWTGYGLNEPTTIDRIPTIELRARLQQAFGPPTKKVEQVIDEGLFGRAAGATIQFEYFFMVNDSIPFTVLDVDGPFSNGLTYGGVSKYIDLMPQIKREFSRKLMGVDSLARFKDYFYSPEDDQWYLVEYENGVFRKDSIDTPEGFPQYHN
ncbi:MAG: hypothetical protein ACQETE_00910 [Bacteroidota bacterium]